MIRPWSFRKKGHTSGSTRVRQVQVSMRDRRMGNGTTRRDRPRCRMLSCLHTTHYCRNSKWAPSLDQLALDQLWAGLWQPSPDMAHLTKCELESCVSHRCLATSCWPNFACYSDSIVYSAGAYLLSLESWSLWEGQSPSRANSWARSSQATPKMD